MEGLSLLNDVLRALGTEHHHAVQLKVSMEADRFHRRMEVPAHLGVQFLLPLGGGPVMGLLQVPGKQDGIAQWKLQLPAQIQIVGIFPDHIVCILIASAQVGAGGQAPGLAVHIAHEPVRRGDFHEGQDVPLNIVDAMPVLPEE